MRKTSIVILFVAMVSCHPDKSRTIDSDSQKFSTTDASELFFKNIRRSSYNVQEDDKLGIDTYILKSYDQDTIKNPLMVPRILISWRNDQAYIMFRESAAVSVEAILIDKKDTFRFDNAQIRNHAQIGTEIYNAIQRKQSVDVITTNQVMPFFTTSDKQNDFRITMFDFFRLTEIL